MNRYENYRHQRPQETFAGFLMSEVLTTIVAVWGYAWLSGDLPGALVIGAGSFAAMRTLRAMQRLGFLRRLALYLHRSEHAKIGSTKNEPFEVHDA